MPGEFISDTSACVDRIIAAAGPRLVVGMPLGLGKPNQLINALYRRVKAEPSLHLKILTALTLEKPAPGKGVEAAFMGPILQRVFGDYEDLDYIADLRRNALPGNVEVCEFFFRPGAFLDNAHAQQHYICANYTHAARDVFAQGCNVALQLVARRTIDGVERLSLSSNPDTSPELIALMRAAHARGERACIAVAQVNNALPFMFHDAEVAPDLFDLVLDHPPQHTRLFGPPKEAVGNADYLIGLQASSLLRDGGTVQIGIGALGDAIVHGAILRQRDNATWREVLDHAGVTRRNDAAIAAIGGTWPFERGLYGASEMFVDGFLHLYRAGILKRRVYDFAPLQRLLNQGAEETVAPEWLGRMEADGVRVLRTTDFEALRHHGVLRDECGYDHGYIVAPDGTRIMANLASPESRRALAEKCLGTHLRRGVVLHGAFFLGPQSFYDGLRDLSDEARRDFFMTGVANINQLDEDPPLYRAQRVDARFMNTGLMATLTGAVVSDGLEDGRVLSGVGGQYNFVAMAHQLPGGRSVLMVRATREAADGQVTSNIVWNYGHCTIPRHLRDVVVTEYGIAVLRSATDSEVIKAMLNVADSRFQDALLAQAVRAGKLPAGYRIPDAFRDNTPQRLAAALAPYRARNLFPAFPFGTELTPEEVILGQALKAVKARAARGKVAALVAGLKPQAIPPRAWPFLDRVGLRAPSSLADRVTRSLLVQELAALGAI